MLWEVERLLDISIHTPAKGVTENKIRWAGNVKNFNPHSREGSDIFGKSPLPISDISIHTPAKGVTTRSDLESFILSISIHTPAKGVTIAEDVSNCSFSISIHTPAKGVTAILPNFRLYIL